MGFLVDNLQYYVQVSNNMWHTCVCVGVYDSVTILQVDVLEAQFTQLTEKIQSTHDFESIKHAHESFVTTLQSQLFFTMPAVSSMISVKIIPLKDCGTYTF